MENNKKKSKKKNNIYGIVFFVSSMLVMFSFGAIIGISQAMIEIGPFTAQTIDDLYQCELDKSLKGNYTIEDIQLESYRMYTIFTSKGYLETSDIIWRNESIVLPNQKTKLHYVYNCNDLFISDHYNCPGIAYQNLTGKYCDDVLVCENKYEVVYE